MPPILVPLDLHAHSIPGNEHAASDDDDNRTVVDGAVASPIVDATTLGIVPPDWVQGSMRLMNRLARYCQISIRKRAAYSLRCLPLRELHWKRGILRVHSRIASVIVVGIASRIHYDRDKPEAATYELDIELLSEEDCHARDRLFTLLAPEQRLPTGFTLQTGLATRKRYPWELRIHEALAAVHTRKCNCGQTRSFPMLNTGDLVYLELYLAKDVDGDIYFDIERIHLLAEAPTVIA